ncbi:MAG: hypothetical protein ABIH25_04095 [Candidatus Woesearchaeota archaeon]
MKKYPRSELLPIANKIKNKLKKIKGVVRVEIAGSIRRKKEMVKDIDILVSAKNHELVIEKFVNMSEVGSVVSKGSTRSSVKLKKGINVDLRVVDDSSYGAALQYFTGSKEYDIVLRIKAIRKGLKLNEYGVFNRKTGKKIAGKTEEGVFKALGLEYVKPEKREVN